MGSNVSEESVTLGVNNSRDLGANLFDNIGEDVILDDTFEN
jgi:hypothetical protein